MVLRENSLGWKFGEERTSGSAFVDTLATVFYQICPGSRSRTLADRGIHVPGIFQKLGGEG